MNGINKSILENDARLSNLQKRELIFKLVVIGDFGVGEAKINNAPNYEITFSTIINIVIINLINFLTLFVFLGKTSIVNRYTDGT